MQPARDFFEFFREPGFLASIAIVMLFEIVFTIMMIVLTRG